MESASLIDAARLSRAFGSLIAVEEISLRVEAGEVVALLGPNGAGKTTTMQMLAAILSPSAGEAQVAGYNVRTHAQAVRRVTGIMLDEPGFYGEMPVEEYLFFFARLYGLRRREARPYLHDLMDRFGLMPKRRARLDTLSKGMRQKVSLTRALLHRPRVLLLDEPTSALDPLSARAVQEHILDRRAAGDAIIISTHNLPEAEAVADRVAIVARGRLRRLGTLETLSRYDEQYDAYTVTVCGNTTACVDSLQRVEDIEAVEVTSQHHDELQISYLTTNARRANTAVIAVAQTAGATVLTLAQRRRGLSEVYLATMEEAERCA